MDWNASYENQETPWDKGRATPVLTEVIERHPGIFKGHVLVPGCGLGHDARVIAQEGVSVVGADIAPLALEKAHSADPDHLVEFRLVDVLSPPDDLLQAFNVVWEHTCLCALDPGLRTAYAQSIKTMLKPGGTVAGVFFINPEMDPGETGPPYGISVEALTTLWQDVGLEVVDSWVPVTGFEGRIGRELAMILR